MKRSLLLASTVACFLITQFSAGERMGRAQDTDVRSPVLAGTWYPGQPEVLRQAITTPFPRQTLPVLKAKSSPSSCLMQDTFIRARLPLTVTNCSRRPLQESSS